MAAKRKRRGAGGGAGGGQKKNVAAAAVPDEDEVTFHPSHKRPRLASSAAPPTSDPPPAPRRSPNGFLLPDPLPPGLVLRDNRGEAWQIGRAIGLGGFGEIYAARKNGDGHGAAEDFVVKVEPHANGPLFVEIAFYLKAAQSHLIEQFKSERGLTHLGVPHFVASGSFYFNAKRFRFLVLPRFGMDLQAIMDDAATQRPATVDGDGDNGASDVILGGGSSFSLKTACDMAVQVLNALEYIHSHGYIHKDVKGSNLLLGRGSRRQKIFLVDFGLCSKFLQQGRLHKPYQPDRRWAHEGTMEYTSRDCHQGCFSRRGDIEVLFYNMVEWLGGKLPWDDLLAQERQPPVKPTVIQEQKKDAFRDHDAFLANCFPGSAPGSREQQTGLLRRMMQSIHRLKFEDAPDYQYLRFLLTCQMQRSTNFLDEVTLNIELTATPTKEDVRRSEGKENKAPNVSNGHETAPLRGSKIASAKKAASPAARQGAKLASPAEGKRKRPVTPTKAVDGGVKDSHMSIASYKSLENAAVRLQCEESLKNPTEAMLDQMDAMKRRRRRKEASESAAMEVSIGEGEGTTAGRKRTTAPKTKRVKTWKSPVAATNLTPAMAAIVERQRTRKRKRQDISGDDCGGERDARASPSSNSHLSSPNKIRKRGISNESGRRKTPDCSSASPSKPAIAATNCPVRTVPIRLLRSKNEKQHQHHPTSPPAPPPSSIRTTVSQAVENLSGFFRGVSRSIFPSLRK